MTLFENLVESTRMYILRPESLLKVVTTYKLKNTVSVNDIYEYAMRYT